MFKPKILTTLKEYNRQIFLKDLVAGIIVGIVALPLSIAFAIASGVSPEKGLYTAIIAGFTVSVLGGSRVQIAGPTGAFIVVIYGIVMKYGVEGLTIATFMAGIFLMVMGFVKLGNAIKFIPHPLIVGFTSGIALIIFSSQIKDLFGLTTGPVPADFIEKWALYAHHFTTINPYALVIGIGTVIISFTFHKVSRKIPGSLVAIIIATVAVAYFKLPVETIGTRFGTISASLPKFSFLHISWQTVKELIHPAFTIALLGAIESLLSAVVADGMIRGSHNSNMELVAQGTANVLSSLFGGIPATGAIARTATNIKNGGRTPVAGIVHAITLLIIVLFAGKWATLIPLSCLAGILVVVAYNMSEWHSFIGSLKGSKGDAAVLLVTFFLTVIVDLTLAIEVGIVLAVFLFIRQMAKVSHIENITSQLDTINGAPDPGALSQYTIPPGVEVYEIEGPFFFAAAYKFTETIKIITTVPKVLVVRMRSVPFIDATGLNVLAQIVEEAKRQNFVLVISGIRPNVFHSLEKAHLVSKIGAENIKTNIVEALERAGELVE
jgi:SulP family sulfate permease